MKIEWNDMDWERFENLCAFNKLVIGGTIFPYKHIHKVTWVSTDYNAENQIDHLCVSKKIRKVDGRRGNQERS